MSPFLFPVNHDADGGEDDLDDFFQAVDTTAGDGGVDSPVEIKVPPRLGLLAPLSNEEFDVVARSAKLGFVTAGKPVFRQGSVADRFFILVDGSAQVERDGEVIGTLEPGSFFGESALLVGGRRSATVTTLSDCSLWSVDYAAFKDVVSEHLLANEQAADEVRSRLDATPPESFG